MAVNRFDFERRQLERDLSALERRYDPQGEPYRRYAQDKETILRLLRNKVIDQPHAEMLLAAAQRKHDEVVRKPRYDAMIRRKNRRMMLWLTILKIVCIFVLAAMMVGGVKKLVGGG